MKAEKPQSHSTYSQECSKQLSSQEDETPNPQPRSSHLGCPHAIPLHTTPLSHSPVQAIRGLHSFSCPRIVTEAHGPAPEGCWGPGCSHTCCFHLSSANSYPGPTVCQAPFCVFCGFPMIISSWGFCLFPSILWCTGRRLHHDAPAQNSLVAFDGKGPQGYLQRAGMWCKHPLQAMSPATNTAREVSSPVGRRGLWSRAQLSMSLGQSMEIQVPRHVGAYRSLAGSPCHLYRRCKTTHVHSLGVEILTINSSTHYFILSVHMRKLQVTCPRSFS